MNKQNDFLPPAKSDLNRPVRAVLPLKLQCLLSKDSERGGATVAVVVFMLFALVVVTASITNRARELRAQDTSIVRLQESWQAKSGAAVLDRAIQSKLPDQYQTDVSFARGCTSSSASLPIFDEREVPAGQSVPAAFTYPDRTEMSCNQNGGLTSLLGNINNYLQNRKNEFQRIAAQKGFGENTVRVAAFQEAVRRFSGSETAYQAHYIIDGRGGRFGRVRLEGDVVLGSASQPTCGTSATLSADRNTINRGEVVTLTVTYTLATHLRVIEANTGGVIHETDVAEAPNPVNYSFTFAPAATNSYRVEATGSLPACRSVSGDVQVVVNEPPANLCSVNPPRIFNFTSSALEVNQGEEVILQWATAGAVSQVLLNGTPVNQNENNYRAVINADTTFTLRVIDSDPGNDCPVERQVTVRVRAVVSCSINAPNVSFNADRTSIQTGQTVNFAWNVAGLQSGGQVVWTEPNGTTASVAATGSATRTFNTAGAYIFKLKGANYCPDGAERAQEIVRTIAVAESCPLPTINSFSASPDTVITGGAQTIRLSWNLSGAVDSVSISPNIGAVAGNYVDINQPQTTTDYTLTVTGCGERRTATARVTVNNAGGPPNTGSCWGTEQGTFFEGGAPWYGIRGYSTVYNNTLYIVVDRNIAFPTNVDNGGYAFVVYDKNGYVVAVNNNVPGVSVFQYNVPGEPPVGFPDVFPPQTAGVRDTYNTVRLDPSRFPLKFRVSYWIYDDRAGTGGTHDRFVTASCPEGNMGPPDYLP